MKTIQIEEIKLVVGGKCGCFCNTGTLFGKICIGEKENSDDCKNDCNLQGWKLRECIEGYPRYRCIIL